MTADSENEINALKAIGHICAETLQKMIQAVRPGLSTLELDEIGRGLLASKGARSAPEGTYQFPGATCISVSPVIAHGIPGDHVLAEGELIHIDVSAELDGYFADTGASLWVGKRTPQIHKLLEATRSTLNRALQAARAGRPLNEIGKTIQHEAARRGYTIIHELTGHGIGRGLHEEPGEIFNFYNPRDHRIMKNGWVLAIEPFLTTGHGRIRESSDGWSLRTADNAIAAQFEHTIIVTDTEPIVLTV